ncbi:tetratricopeptide repeat protein [Bifidobacterium bombi]|uniref:Helicase n=1 Tax=Bifidobacterium bombi DSM 19703 TaxID=1341695 RepID=A0A080N1U7_9BIFI|nr:hypothetical protein [Bifidobacterium bombi]KFF30813.1 hypothetical protein BBOMB_0125 [Bifidobacterium bombi DSM 19703]
MAENQDNLHSGNSRGRDSRSGGDFHGGRPYGGHGGGFRKSSGGREGGGYRGGSGSDRGGYRGRDDRRDFHRDGERGGFHGRDDRRDFHRDDDRGGYRGNGGGYRGGSGSDRGGYRGRDDARGNGSYRGNGGYRGNGDRRDFHRDGERGGFHGRDDRRDFHRNDGYRGNSGGRDMRRNNRGGMRDDRRNGGVGPYHRSDRDHNHSNGRDEFMGKGIRRNSDGTTSFPSQNPYTDRRPDEPRMPRGMEWSMLSKDEKERLRGLSKEHAENIGLHILAAYSLEESDPQAALEHAKWVAHQASRIDFARETLAFVAYRQGDYKLALREFQTAQRMNGFMDYLPFIADCERGLGEPKKAINIALGEDAKRLQGESKAEMFLVYAGALGDLGAWDQAIAVVHKLGSSNGLPGEYRMRAIQAEQYFLEQAGRGEEAADLDVVLEKLELKYADVDEDDESEQPVIDYDLEALPDELMDELGITEDDAQYAPEEYDEEYDAGDSAQLVRDELSEVNDASVRNADDEAESAAGEAAPEDGVEVMSEAEAKAEAEAHNPDAPDEDDENQLPAELTQEGAGEAAEPALAEKVRDDADVTVDAAESDYSGGIDGDDSQDKTDTENTED